VRFHQNYVQVELVLHTILSLVGPISNSAYKLVTLPIWPFLHRKGICEIKEKTEPQTAS